MGKEATDPRKVSGGSIAGPGGPYGKGDVVLDVTNAVILNECEVSIVDPEKQPICAMLLHGRINKTTEQVQIMFLMNEDGAAALVTQLIGLQSRAGTGKEFLRLVKERMEEMPL